MIEEEDEDWQEEEEHFVPEDLEDYHDLGIDEDEDLNRLSGSPMITVCV